MLGINDNKTDFTVINGSRRVGEADIMSSTCIKALGVHIDNTISMQNRSMMYLELASQSSVISTRSGSVLLRMVQRQW